MSFIILFSVIGALIYFLASFFGTILLNKRIIIDNKEVVTSIVSPFIGVCLLITIISVFFTGFKTINSLIILLFIIFYFVNEKTSEQSTNVEVLKKMVKNTAVFFALLLLTIIASVFYDYTKILNLDFLFYASVVSDGLAETGVENAYGYFNNYISGDVYKVAPYHYFEFWLVVLFKKITGEYTSVIVLKYLVYTFFKSFFMMGIFENVKLLKPKVSLWFILIVFITTFIPIDAFFKLFTNGWDVHASFWERPNFLTYLFVIISALPFLFYKEYLNFTLFLLFLPIVSITTAPVIFTTIFVLLIILFWFKKIKVRPFSIAMLTTVGTAFGIALFYILLGEKMSTLESEKSILDYYKTGWKAMLYYMITLSSITVIPLIVLAFVTKKHVKLFPFFELIVLSMFSIVSGVVIFQLIYFIDNAYQFVYVGYTMLYVIVVLFIVKGVLLSNEVKYFFYLFPVMGLVTFVVNSKMLSSQDIRMHNFNTIEQVEIDKSDAEKLEGNGNAIIVIDEEKIKTVLPKKRHLLTNLPFSTLCYFGEYNIIPLIDSNKLYIYNKRDSLQTFKKARGFNDRLPQKWKSLNNINDIIKTEDVSILVLPKSNWYIRSEIKAKAIDSLIICQNKVLIFK